MYNYKECIDFWDKGNKEKLLREFLWKFTYSSNRIENNNTHLRDVLAIFRSREIDSKSDITEVTKKEIENHKYISHELEQSYLNSDFKMISIELIKTMHATLMHGCFSDKLVSNGEVPGTFKKGDYVVGLHDVGTAPEDVEKDLKSLLDEMSEICMTSSNALKMVAYFHCWFETIHPFADGNGRVGRFLLNYLLLSKDLPPIILYETDRNRYYLTLEHFTDTQDIMPMADFLSEQAYKTWLKDYKYNNKDMKKLNVFLQD